MPRVNSIYQLPPGVYGTPGATIESAKYNTTIDDLAADANAARPIGAGGTGATNAPAALDNLGATAALALKFDKVGGSITGNVSIVKSGPGLIMTDTANSERSMRNEAGYIGFFDANGNALLRTTEGGTTLVAGNVTIAKNSPAVFLNDSATTLKSVRNEGGVIGFFSAGGGGLLTVTDTGGVVTGQLGNLKTYIDGTAATAAGAKVSKTGDTMTGPLIVSLASPRVELNDTATASRSIRNESGSIGFYNAAGSSLLSVNAAGAVSSLQLGDLKTYIDAQRDTRVAKTGDTMTGALTISLGSPRIDMNDTSTTLRSIRNEAGSIGFYGPSGVSLLSVNGTTGAVNSSQLGDLKTYIDTQRDTRVAKIGDTMTGNLTLSKASPSITMNDTATATRSLRNEGGVIGMFSGGGSALLTVADTGAVSTAQFGDLSTRIETRAAFYADDRIASLRARAIASGIDSYILARINAGGTTAPAQGSDYAGSTLFKSSDGASQSLSGTWRCLGAFVQNGGINTGLFIRYA